MTFWDKYTPMFDLPENDQVFTEPFLVACNQLLPMFDKLGKAYIPVKKDIGGNVQTLLKKHASNPEKCRTISGLLEDEFDKGMKAEKPSDVALACLWLKRALEFVCLFLKYLHEDWTSGEKKENICSLVQKAYDSTLKKYHTWITQKVFSLVSRAVPYRKDFLIKLCEGDETLEEQCYSGMAKFVEIVTANTVVIGNHLIETNLDSNATV